MKRRIFATILTILFLGAMFGGLFHMTAGMDMSGEGGASGCPFMAHEETLCSMSIFDHLGAWQADFMAVVPTLTLLLGAVAAALVLLAVAPHLLFSDQKLLYQRRVLYKQPTRFLVPIRPLQELFSNGILNPKLF